MTDLTTKPSPMPYPAVHTPLGDALRAIDALTLDGNESVQLIRAKCRALIRGYDAKWSDVPWCSEAIEETYHLPLVNPETGRESRTWTHAGKYDGLVRYIPSNKRYVREAKTTSESIEDPNAPFWRILQIESQVSSYHLATWQQGDKVDGTLYDVIRKPSIRPKAITKAEQKEMIQRSTYCGFTVPREFRMLERENHELYEARLYRDCLENHAKYFQRRTIPRLDADLLEHASELWQIGKEILETRNTGRHFKNHRACFTYSTPCEYLGLCSGMDSTDSDHWERQENVHVELEPLAGDGRSVLTNSRVSTYQTCRRKHFLRYEIGIRKRDDEEREPLFFGRVFHEALSCWWSHFKENVNEHCDNSPIAGDRTAVREGLEG